MAEPLPFKLPKLLSFHVGEGTLYSFRFDGFGWAIVIVSDATGVLSILSDWGNWSNRWHTGHLGAPSLHHFLARTDYGYVGNKLGIPDHRASVEETAKEFRKRIIERRRESGAGYERGRYDEAGKRRGYSSLTKAEAREAWDAIGAWESNRRLDDFDGLDEFFEEPWEYIAHETPDNWIFWREFLWPTFQKAIRDRLATQTPAVASG